MAAVAPSLLDSFSALADQTRCRMLALLDQQELTVSELCTVIQLPQSTVSRQLRTLADAGWVTSRRDGTSRYYALGIDHRDEARAQIWQLTRQQLAGRAGVDQDARRLARVAPSSIDPGTRARLLGEAADRLGDAEAAFAAFAEMNRLTAREAADPAAAAAAYRGQISALGARITPEWYAGWWKPRPAPVFLFGFPRSGTTLLDTFLAGHPGTLVLEEKPVLKAAADALGDPARLPMIGHDEIVTLRQAYYDALDAIAPAAAEAELVVDKLPLGIADTALAHRLFPNARFIFVERHPCDVVLSGYMTRFDPRGGMANFLTLEDLAELYDVTMEHWRRCREVFPLDVHTIRYERLVADPEGELRPLAGFLGIEWTPRLLDHRASAKARAFIGTPSYAQVGEPIYSRASGRWRRYRRFIEPVLPKLLPWAERMDYPI